MSERRRLRALAEGAVGAFVTGLLFLLPFLLTIVAIDWLVGYAQSAFGPESFIGRTLASGGSVLFGAGEALAFWAGLALLFVGIGLLGLVVQTRFRARLERGFDHLVERVPFMRSLYRPIAQFVRLLGPQGEGDLKGMRVVAVRYIGRGNDALGLLVTPETFDVGGEPRLLVYLPSAPMAMSGTLVLMPPENVVPMDGLSVEDLIKIQVSLGTVRPAEMAQAASATP